jgi:hypothetical protein
MQGLRVSVGAAKAAVVVLQTLLIAHSAPVRKYTMELSKTLSVAFVDACQVNNTGMQHTLVTWCCHLVDVLAAPLLLCLSLPQLCVGR